MSRFLITGLPRSRTAWFSVACTTDRATCYHEPYFADFAALKSWWMAWPGAHAVGVSDSGLGTNLAQVFDEIKPRTLIVERPIFDVLRSFDAYVGHHALYAREPIVSLHKALEAVEHPLIKRVAYADLERRDVLEGCFDWLGVQPLNLEQISHMRVNSDLGYNMAKLRQLRAAV